ncbi:MAG: hypothetical protein ING31_13080 [Burkholderiales bacterium]|nr:hypothetical protein [Burkholderiales bacterium]
MPSLLEILKDPNYTSANEETKRAIFERWAPQDTNYTSANAETQAAIRQRFGIAAPAAPAQPVTPPGVIPGAAPGHVAPPAQPAELETTAAGVTGAITRGAALPLAGTIGGGAIAGPPGALVGAGAGVLAPVVADPLVSLFNRTFGTNVQRPSDALQQLLTRMGVAQPRSDVEKFTQQMTESVAAGVVLPAQAARTAQALAAGTRAAPVVTPIAETVRVGGMGPTGGRTMRERIGAGMISGGIGAIPVAENPADVAVGAGIGGVLPPLAKGGKDVIKGLYETTVEPFLNPALVAQKQMFRAAGGTVGAAERTIGEIESGMNVPVTPGFQRTLPETIVAGGGDAPPTLAVLTERIRGSSPQVARETYRLMNERAGALQAQLVRINQQIDQQGAMLQPGALDEIVQVRDSILRTIETERGQMEAVLGRPAAGMPAGPQGTGEEILTRAQQLQKQIRDTEITPAYQRALTAGGESRVNIDSVVGEAERVLGRPLSSFDPATAPAIVRRILALRDPIEETPTILGPDGRPLTPSAPPQITASATLSELDDLRKAINSDITAASRGSSTLAGVETRNLLGLQRTIDAAIDASDTLPTQAKDLYRDAVSKYRDLYAPRFREGETARILKPGMFGENRVEPAQIVQQFTKDTDAANQFVTTFAGDPQAYNSLRNGILGQFRLAAVDPQTQMIDPGKAAAFLQNKAEVLAVLDNNGMGIRNTLQQFEQEAAQGAEALTKLNAIGGPFKDKTPGQLLDYILSSGERMGVALNRSTPQDRDTIRRVVSTRLNQMLTQTPGGEPLTEAGVMRVVADMIDQSGNIKSAYRLALGPDLTKEFSDRAKGLRLVIETGKDPMLKNPNAIAPTLRSANFTPEQLPDMQLVLDDLARARKVEEAARAARQAAAPSGRDILSEEAEGATSRFDKMSFLQRWYTVARNVYVSLKEQLNPRIAARLANMLYNNPEEAATALRAEIARVQKKARPSTIGRAVPAVSGSMGAGASTQAVDTSLPEQPEPAQ